MTYFLPCPYALYTFLYGFRFHSVRYEFDGLLYIYLIYALFLKDYIYIQYAGNLFKKKKTYYINSKKTQLFYHR